MDALQIIFSKYKCLFTISSLIGRVAIFLRKFGFGIGLSKRQSWTGLSADANLSKPLAAASRYYG